MLEKFSKPLTGPIEGRKTKEAMGVKGSEKIDLVPERFSHVATSAYSQSQLALSPLADQQEGSRVGCQSEFPGSVDKAVAELAKKLANVETQLQVEREARREAEQGCAEAKKWSQTLVENIPQLVWTAEPDGTMDFVNQRVLQYLKRSREEIIGWNWKHALHPEDLPTCLKRWTEALESGEPYEMELRLKRGGDGVYLWHLVRAVPLRDPMGNIVKWMGTTTDISKLKKIEDTLQNTNKRFFSLTQSTKDAIIVVTEDGKIESWNRGAQDMFGYTEQEILGKPVLDLFPDCDRQIFEPTCIRSKKNLGGGAMDYGSGGSWITERWGGISY